MSLAKSLSSNLSSASNIVKKVLWNNASSYLEVCTLASQSEYAFNQFRRNRYYTQIVEYLDPEMAKVCAEEIGKQGHIDLIADREKLVLNDVYGNPNIMDFDIIGKYSPNTLRYAKVVSDIIDMFSFQKRSQGISIVEIGVGYGGQCLLLSQFLNISSYTLIDLTPPLALTKRYLESFALPCKLNFITLNEIDTIESDLCISNYAFSELNRELQDVYFTKVMRHAANGYMTYNYVTPENYKTYLATEFAEKLPYKTTIVEEKPLTHPLNVLLTWKSEE